jgi:hypothetical protein
MLSIEQERPMDADARIAADKAKLERELRAIIALCDAICEAVEAAGTHGAPAGHLYAALMAHVSLDLFEQLMRMLVEAGRVKKVGLLYYSN